MPLQGYFLAIAVCDHCQAELLLRARSQQEAVEKLYAAGWNGNPQRKEVTNSCLCPTCYALVKALPPEPPKWLRKPATRRRHMRVVK